MFWSLYFVFILSYFIFRFKRSNWFNLLNSKYSNLKPKIKLSLCVENDQVKEMSSQPSKSMLWFLKKSLNGSKTIFMQIRQQILEYFLFHNSLFLNEDNKRLIFVWMVPRQWNLENVIKQTLLNLLNLSNSTWHCTLCYSRKSWFIKKQRNWSKRITTTIVCGCRKWKFWRSIGWRWRLLFDGHRMRWKPNICFICLY